MHKNNNIVPFIRLLRPINLLVIAFTAMAVRFWLLAPFLEVFQLQFSLSDSWFLVYVASLMLIAAGGNVINDYFDNKADIINRQDGAIINVKLDRRVGIYSHQILTGLGLVLGCLYAYKNGTFILVSFHIFAAISLWFYSIYFKSRLLIGNILVAFLTACIPLATGVFEILPILKSDGFRIAELMREKGLEGGYYFQILLVWVLGLSAFAFLVNVIRELVKDIQDQEGDKSIGRKTLPLVKGEAFTKQVVYALSILFVLALYTIEARYLGRDFTKLYLALGVAMPVLISNVFLFKNKSKWASLCLKLAMLAGVFYLYFIQHEFI